MSDRRDVVCISSIDWDFIWQGHQEIMSRLAAAGHRVLFVENTGVRAPRARDLPRVRQRLYNWWRGTKGFREERPNVFVYSPLLLPLPYSRIARTVNRFLLARALRRWMRAIGFDRPIVWTFLPTPLAMDLIADLNPALTIYYCIDDLASSSAGAKRIVTTEEQLFLQADLVFVTSERLRQRAARFNDRVHFFPFGVNFERFDRVRQDTAPPPEDVAALPRPLVGYLGGLHQWIDQSLIADVAARMPEVTFALIGPPQVDVSTLGRCANVRLLGQRAHETVPSYVKAFDVGLVPYRVAEYTLNVYPTKLNEYLVMGIPVVATDLPEIRGYNARHGDLVAIASDAAGFAAAIRRALNDSAAPERERRVGAAHENSWQRRVGEMNALIDEALARRAVTPRRWEETLRRLYRDTRTHVAGAIIALVAVFLLLFETNVVWWGASPLKVSAPLAAADAIVVFAGGAGESGQAGVGTQERLQHAIDVYKAHYAQHLVFSSGYTYSFPEAELMRSAAIEQGVPAGAIELERRSTNTYENVAYTAAIFRQHGWHSMLLVTSPYHMRRALMVWHKAAPALEVVPAPPPRSQFYDHTRGASVAQIEAIAHEYAAIAGYWLRGWI